MIFNVDRQRFDVWVEAWPLGHGPAFEDTAKLQPEVIVQTPGSVLLNDIEHATVRSSVSRGLICPLEVPLLAILFQAHG
jgi:hypothetical protein